MMCASCNHEALRWLDTRPSQMVRPGIKIVNHATYDGTAAGVLDNIRSMNEEWRYLVRRQTELIARICRRDHQPGQIALFEVAA